MVNLVCLKALSAGLELHDPKPISYGTSKLPKPYWLWRISIH